MADPFLRALEKELSKLEAKLATNDDFTRWQRVKSTLEAYQSKAAAPQKASGDAPKASTPAAVTAVVPPTEPPAKNADIIIGEAVKYLREKKQRVNSTVMAQDLQARGVNLRGNNPAATLSAYLSAAKDQIDNVRGEGYGLKEWSSSKSGGSSEMETPDSGKLSGASESLH
ncbi:MAG: hypothetical protein ACM30I_12475 [Gemmatimonas sp.]